MKNTVIWYLQLIHAIIVFSIWISFSFCTFQVGKSEIRVGAKYNTARGAYISHLLFPIAKCYCHKLYCSIADSYHGHINVKKDK